MKVRVLACIISATALISCSNDEESAARGALVIAQAKAAMGGAAWDEIRIWHETGEFIAPSGAVSTFEHWGDLRTLSVRNRASSQPGPMVFDGTAAYACADASCAARTSLDAGAVRSGAYLVSYGFFFPDRFSASLKYLGVRADDGVRYDVVKVSPAGLETIELWVDQSTHLISRIVYAGGRERTDLSDYRRVGAVRVPFVSQVEGATMKSSAVSFHAEGAVVFAASGDSSEPPAR